MGPISRLFYPPTRTPLKFIGRPARFTGPGHEISVSYVKAADAKGEPMNVHCLPGYVSTMYLVEYVKRNQLLLLDCGSPSDVRRVKFYVEDVMNEGRQDKLTLANSLKLAVTTHCHFDHSGGSEGYLRLGVPMAVPTDLECSYVTVTSRIQQFMEINFFALIAHRMGRRREDPFVFSKGLLGPHWTWSPKTSLVLGDGQSLPHGFEDWVAVKIPGHTSHMIGLFHSPTGIFYASDFTVKLKRGFFAPRPVNYLWAYQHTWKRLRGLQVSCLLLPHGGIVDVAKEHGSWEAILDEIERHMSKDTNSATAGKEASYQVNWGQLFGKLLDIPGVEKRDFTPEALDNGPVPKRQDPPQPACVVR
ncbi:metallo-beta-lactamase superfamily [Angomonas deanei]|uniref:Metallo-beta-lactamase domain-containing protein n=1 Tax=Angomonas deanei TaxID=59799 RepID=A0A7G2CEC9_9TRYP|nr:metallo-beta-lactamase superfamily [Angomonas deanei]CAD2218228.1 hypothetical protein, conserved [Angomonas deanei]|eukprot:EPY41829.1 metallo-beta-lactamase superfamily [Angomonas deanei]